MDGKASMATAHTGWWLHIAEEGKSDFSFRKAKTHWNTQLAGEHIQVM